MSENYIYDPFNSVNSICFEENHEIIKNPFVSYNEDNVEVSFRWSNYTTDIYIVPYANIRACRKGITNPKSIICFLDDITSVKYINNVLLYLLEYIEKKVPILIHVKHIIVDSILIDLPKSYKDKIESIFINYETKFGELYIKIPHNPHGLLEFPPLRIVADADTDEESEECSTDYGSTDESDDESDDESTDEYSSSDTEESESSDEDESDEDESIEECSTSVSTSETDDKIAIYNIDEINHESFKNIIIQDNNYAYMIGEGSKIMYKIDKNNKCCEDTKSLLVLFPEYTEPKQDSSDLVNLVSIAREYKNIKKFIICYGKFLPECKLSFHVEIIN